jgi:hypothetical protein
MSRGGTVWEGSVPRSFTSTALLFRTPVSWTVASATLEIAEPSLPLVTRRRWIEKPDAWAIFLYISDVEASELTVMVSGRFLIGRPRDED